MVKKKVFISFDYEDDKHFKYPLNAQNANPKFDFSFNDRSSQEIDSYNIPSINKMLKYL